MASKLTKVQRCYIEHNATKMDAKEIAADIDVSVRTVLAEIRRLPPQKPTEETPVEPEEKPPEPKPAPKLAKFAVQNGEKSLTVSMTAGQSYDDDELHKKGNGGEQFMKERLGKNIHKIRPDEPTR